MSFFLRKKKRDPSSATKTTSLEFPTKEEPVDLTSQKTSPPRSPISSHPTPVQTQSIFSGLHLSSAAESSNSPSCISTHLSGVEQDQASSEEGVSSFPFLTESEPSNETKGFAFLAQPLAETVSGSEEQEPSAEPSADDPNNALQPRSVENHLPENSPVHEHEQFKDANTSQKTRTSVGTSEKKKKKKAIRPGQHVTKEPFSADVAAGNQESTSNTVREEHCNSAPETIPNLDKEPALQKVAEDVVSSKELKEEVISSKQMEQVVTLEEHLLPSNDPNSNGETVEAGTDQNKENSPVDEELSQLKEVLKKEVKPANYTIQFTHEENLENLLQSYTSGLSKLRTDLFAMEEGHKVKLLECIQVAQKQSARWAENRALREKEAAALADEDYELAEKLNNKIEATAVETEQQIMKTGLVELERWIQDCCKEKDNQLSFQKDMEAKLSVLREEHDAAMEELKKEHGSLLAKEKMQVQSLQNEVERAAGHIALDCSHLEKREQLFQEETSRRAANFINKKEQLSRELGDVESEILQLEKKLAQLKNQKEDIVKDILIEEDKIKAVEKEMYEEQEQLRLERASFQERQDKLTFQQEMVQKKLAIVLKMEQEQEEEQHSLEELQLKASAVWNEVESAVATENQRHHQVKQLLDFVHEGKKLLQPSETLLKSQADLEIKKREQEELTQNQLIGQNKLSQQRRVASDLEAQILEIQESKKVAVACRQFKEASRLAGESKILSQQLEEEQRHLTEAKETLAVHTKKLQELSGDLGEMKESVSQLERKEDELHIHALLQVNSTLSNFSEVLGSNFLSTAMENWKKLYKLLMESLCSKHGIGDVTVHKNADDKCESHYGDIKTGSLSVEEKIKQLEADIEKACQEEYYDRAAELEEELQAIKNQTS